MCRQYHLQRYKIRTSLIFQRSNYLFLTLVCMASSSTVHFSACWKYQQYEVNYCWLQGFHIVNVDFSKLRLTTKCSHHRSTLLPITGPNLHNLTTQWHKWKYFSTSRILQLNPHSRKKGWPLNPHKTTRQERCYWQMMKFLTPNLVQSSEISHCNFKEIEVSTLKHLCKD